MGVEVLFYGCDAEFVLGDGVGLVLFQKKGVLVVFAGRFGVDLGEVGGDEGADGGEGHDGGGKQRGGEACIGGGLDAGVFERDFLEGL